MINTNFSKNSSSEIITNLIVREKYFGALALINGVNSDCFSVLIVKLISTSQCLNYFTGKTGSVNLLATKQCQKILSNVLKNLENNNQCINDKINILLEVKVVNFSTLGDEICEYLHDLINEGIINPKSALGSLKLSIMLPKSADFLKETIQKSDRILTTADIRVLYEQIKESKDFYAKKELLIYLIDKSPNAYWEYHALAGVYQTQHDYKKALLSYDVFFEMAINKSDNPAIRGGVLRIFECLLYLSPSLASLNKYLLQCPQSIQHLEEVVVVRDEFKNIEESRELLNQQYNPKKDGVGYQWRSLQQLKELNTYLNKKVAIHPNYNDFYELFKLTASLGKNNEAKDWLRKAHEANVLMFKVR